jgi:hypothetical protein
VATTSEMEGPGRVGAGCLCRAHVPVRRCLDDAFKEPPPSLSIPEHETVTRHREGATGILLEQLWIRCCLQVVLHDA